MLLKFVYAKLTPSLFCRCSVLGREHMHGNINFKNISHSHCEASVTTMIKHLHWRSLQQRRTDIRLVMLYKTLHGIVALDLFPQLIPLVRPSRYTHSEAFQLPVITKQFIQYRFLPRTNVYPIGITCQPTQLQHQVWTFSDRRSPACNIN